MGDNCFMATFNECRAVIMSLSMVMTWIQCYLDIGSVRS